MAVPGEKQLGGQPLDAEHQDVVRRLTELGLFNPQKSFKNKEFDTYLAQEAQRSGLEKSLITSELERGSMAAAIIYGLGYLKSKYAPEHGEEGAQKIVMRLWDEVSLATNPNHKELSGLRDKTNRTPEEEARLLDLYEDYFDSSRKKGVNYFAAISPFIENKGLRDDYAKYALAEDTPKLGLAIIGAILLEEAAKIAAKTAGELFSGRPESESVQSTEGRGGITSNEFQDASGIDLSKLVENAGIDPNTPEGDQLMREILTDPNTVAASKEPGAMTQTVMVLAAYDVIEASEEDGTLEGTQRALNIGWINRHTIAGAKVRADVATALNKDERQGLLRTVGDEQTELYEADKPESHKTDLTEGEQTIKDGGRSGKKGSDEDLAKAG
jgi:hypothetical protein